MCDPVTAAVGISAVGAGVTASSQMAAGDYNAAIAEQNAQLAEKDAESALALGVVEENRYRRNVRQLQGSQATAIAANNLEQTGTPLDILTDTALIGEVDALTIRNNAIREAYGFSVDAANTRAQGQLERFKGRSQAAGTILGGAGDSFSTFKLLS